MLIKHRPEDFVVEELTSFQPQPKGPVSVYEVNKRKVDTFEAVRRIATAAKLPLDRLHYAGLKDRQAVTTQLISVVGGRIPNKLRIPGIKVRYLGRAQEPLTAADLDGNRFTLVVRDLEGRDLAGLRRRAEELRRDGIINYFDEQRFGTLRRGQGLPGRLLVQGKFEEAVRQLLCARDPRDDVPTKRFKTLVTKAWGDWDLIAKKWGNRRNAALVRHLQKKPGDFAGALRRMPGKERAIHVFAFQSLIWNESVGRYLTAAANGAVTRTRYVAGELVWPDQPLEHLVETFPLLDHTVRPDDPAVRAAIDAALAAEGLTIETFRIDGIPGCFFKHHERRLRVVPGELTLDPPQRDDERPGRQKVRLSFTLPPGAYATLVLERLFGRAPDDASKKHTRSGKRKRAPERTDEPQPQSRPPRRGRGKKRKNARPR